MAKKKKKKNSKKEKKRKHEMKLASAKRWRERKKAGKVGTRVASVKGNRKRSVQSVGAIVEESSVEKLVLAGWGPKVVKAIKKTQDSLSGLGYTFTQAAIMHLDAGKLG